MKKNKGMTLAEVLVSIVLISIVLLFLFRLLILLRNDESLNESSSNLAIIENTIINDIQDDIYGIGVNYFYPTSTKCSANANTNCCCTISTSTYCIKIFLKNNTVKELSIYTADSTADSIRYNYTNQKLLNGLSFGIPSILKTAAYKGKYRFDTLSIISIPVKGLNKTYTINIIAPSVFDDAKDAKSTC